MHRTLIIAIWALAVGITVWWGLSNYKKTKPELFYAGEPLRKWLPIFATDEERKGCYYEMLPEDTSCVEIEGVRPPTPNHNVTQQPGLPVRNCVYKHLTSCDQTAATTTALVSAHAAIDLLTKETT